MTTFDLAAGLAPTGGITPTGAAQTAEQFGAGFALPNPALVDPQALEGQLLEMMAFNQRSQIPDLPDEVELELLTSDLLPTQRDVGGFLSGLEADLAEAQERVLAARRSPLAPPGAFDMAENPEFGAEDSPRNQFRRMMNNLGGDLFNRPQVIPGDPSSAVIDLKIRGIEAGLLAEDTPLNGLWTPELNNTLHELERLKTSEQLAGNKFGATSTENVLDIMDRFINPTSLIPTAMALDLIPDFEAIGRETKSWGSRFKEWVSSPEDFLNPRKFVAALGPIDDVVFPILNLALLTTGVGSVINFARATKVAASLPGGIAAMRTTQGLAAFEGAAAGMSTFRGASMLGRAKPLATTGTEIRNIAQPGLIGSALSAGGRASKVGDKMADWRTYRGVQLAKRTTQSVGRAGFWGQLQTELAPHRDMGIGFTGDIDQTARERMNSYLNWRTTNPATSVLADVFALPFTPVTLFQQGAIMDPARAVKGTFMNRVARVAEDEAYTAVVYQAFDQSLANNKVMQRQFRTMKPTDAIAYRLTGRLNPTTEDRQRVSAFLTYVGLSEAIKKNAAADVAAMGLSKIENGAAFDRALANTRKWYELRLQAFDGFDPDDFDDMRRWVAQRSGASEGLDLDHPDAAAIAELRTENIEQMMLMGTEAKEALRAEVLSSIDLHLMHRQATANQLFDTLTEEDLYNRFINAAEEFEDFEPFIEGVDYANSPGFLDRLRRQENDLTRAEHQTPAAVKDRYVAQLNSIIGEEFAKFIPFQSADLPALNPMQRPLYKGWKKITVAKLDTPTAEDAHALQVGLETLLNRRRTIQALEDAGDRVPLNLQGSRDVAVTGELFEHNLHEWARKIHNTTVDKLKEDQLNDWVRQTRNLHAEKFGKVMLASERKLRQFAVDVQRLMKQGYGPNVVATLDDRIKAINNADWWDKFRIRNRKFEEGIERDLTLSEKVDELREMKSALASRLVVDPADAAHLESMGYKAVTGDHFLQYDHLVGLDDPLSELAKAHMKRRSFGTFLTRAEHSQLNARRERLFRQKLWARALHLFEEGHWDGDDVETVDELRRLWGEDGTRVDEILATLRGSRRHAMDALEDMNLTDRLSSVIRNTHRQAAQYNIYETPRRQLETLFPDMGPRASKVLQGALQSSGDLGFEYRGLATIQDRLTGEGVIRQSLKYLRYSDEGSELGMLRRAGRLAGFGSHRHEADMYRTWRALGYAALGAPAGALGYGINQNEMSFENLGIGALGGASGGALSGAMGSGVGRTALRFGAAAVGAEAAQTVTGGDDQGLELAAGLAFAMPGFALLRHGTGKAVAAMESRAIGEYSSLARFAQVRNLLRFSLSPIFDAQRYTEGLVLGGTTTFEDANGVRRQLPVTLRPMRKLLADNKDLTEAEVVGRFQAAAAGHDWHDALTAADVKVAEIGILGFSPQKWMAAAFHELTEHGMSADEAVARVKDIYQFGEKARTGLEQSVNFVFFPFSFQKQLMTKLTAFMAEDLGRAVLITDSLKLYEALEERTEFHRLVERHTPVLRDLKKLNAFAYGISPGQFGGINRPVFDAMRATPGLGPGMDEAFNAFLPHGLELSRPEDADSLEDTLQRAIPVWRDAESLWEDIQDQKYAIEHGGARRQLEQQGWNRYSELIAMRTEVLERLDMQPQDMRITPALAPLDRFFQHELRKLREENPAWAAGFARSRASAIERDVDLQARLRAPQATQEEISFYMANGVTGNEDLALIDFTAKVDEFREAYGVNKDELFDLPLPVQEHLRRTAARTVLSAPGFIDHYRRFYGRLLGPIEKEITS